MRRLRVRRDVKRYYVKALAGLPPGAASHILEERHRDGTISGLERAKIEQALESHRLREYGRQLWQEIKRRIKAAARRLARAHIGDRDR